MLVLVDDHSRFKFVMKRKSDAPALMAQFVAASNAKVNTQATAPIRIVGSLHSDNAGEFLSHEFKDLLDASLIAQTTCPPHVHQLNSVAERAIRTIVDLMRVELLSSGLTSTH